MAEEETSNQAMDAVLKTLGWHGRYQVFQIAQTLLCVFPLAFNILSIVFIGKHNAHRCREVDNVTSQALPPDAMNVTYGQCGVTWVNVTGERLSAACPNGLLFDQPVDRSLMSEWNLVCENEALTDVSQTLLLAGMMVGAVLFTSLADRFGRKPFHIGCHMGLLVVGVASALVPTFSAFLPLRFFLGAFQQGTGLCSGILGMEIMPARHRIVNAIMGSFLWSSGMVLLAFVSYLLQDVSWRYLQLAFASFSVYCILQIWYTDESLRWLVDNGKVEKAERILKKASRMNKVSEEDVLAVFRTKALRHAPSSGKAQLFALKSPAAGDRITEKKTQDLKSFPGDAVRKEGGFLDGGPGVGEALSSPLVGAPVVSPDSAGLPQYGLTDFFRHKYVFLCTLVNGFAWLINAMTYYGLSMTSVTLADDMYLGFFLSAVVELPTCIVQYFLVERIGRKKCCDIFHVVAGISLLASVALPNLAGDGPAVAVVVVVLSLLGKFAISITFAVLFLFTPEQFPTNLRNTSLGIASMMGRVGGMLAPYSRTLSRHVTWGPGVIFGVCCLLVPLSMRILPETCGRELPQTIEDMTRYIKSPYTISRRVKKSEEKDTQPQPA